MKNSTLQDANQIAKEFEIRKGSLNADELHIKYLGKKGEINKLLKKISKLEKVERIETAKKINELKSQIEEEVKILRENQKIEENDNAMLSIPVRPTKTGNLHPITTVSRELNQFFHYYGFSVYDGPEIETEYYNFEMMGVPEGHPARELQDTFYILKPELLLRTQTSSIEARELERQNPPIRFVSAGKVFRNETANKSNGAFFHHYQGVCVDTNITMANLKWIFEKSLKFILGPDTKIRFRSKYYPEVEPGLSPDVMCPFCDGDGCEVCKYRGWIEIAGGGMIHPDTLKKAKIDPKTYSGFAFGWGLDRIAMSKYNIRDIRLLYNGSLVYN